MKQTPNSHKLHFNSIPLFGLALFLLLVLCLHSSQTPFQSHLFLQPFIRCCISSVSDLSTRPDARSRGFYPVGGGTNLTLGKKRPRGAASCLLSLYLSQMKTPPQRGSTALALINTLLFTTARTHTIGSVDHFPIFGNNLRARNNEVKTTVVLLRAKQIGIVPTLYFWSAKSIFVGNHTSCG